MQNTEYSNTSLIQSHEFIKTWTIFLPAYSKILLKPAKLYFNGMKGSCLKTGQHSIFVIIRKIKKIDTRMLDTAN